MTTVSHELMIIPIRKALGATVTGLNVADGVSERVIQQLLEAWHEHLVLFFPALDLDEEQQIVLGSAFGELAPVTGMDEDGKRLAEQKQVSTSGPKGEVLILDRTPSDSWHSDLSFEERPPIGSLLRMTVGPERGGDTLWSNQYAAYETLSSPIRALVDELAAEHEVQGKPGKATHPVVITHPTTGRRALFVSPKYTRRVVGLSQIESDGLLRMLHEHNAKPEFHARWTWSVGDAVLWDNRVTMHYACFDYGDAPRVVRRVTVYERD